MECQVSPSTNAGSAKTKEPYETPKATLVPVDLDERVLSCAHGAVCGQSY